MSNEDFAWPRLKSGFIHCIRRSLGEGGHLAPQTALRDSAFPQSEATPQVLSAEKDNFRKADDVRWQFGVPFGLNLNN